jgi:hypothetical protein
VGVAGGAGDAEGAGVAVGRRGVIALATADVGTGAVGAFSADTGAGVALGAGVAEASAPTGVIFGISARPAVACAVVVGCGSSCGGSTAKVRHSRPLPMTTQMAATTSWRLMRGSER